MKIEMRDLQRALAVLRAIEAYDPETAAPGVLGTLRANAAISRINLESSLALEAVEVES
jgi:hypothetical protein